MRPSYTIWKHIFNCFRVVPLIGLIVLVAGERQVYANILQDSKGFHERANSLKNKARTQGAVRIIVQFDEFASALPELADEEREGRLAVIKGMGDDISSVVNGQGKSKNIKKFQYTPYLALEVDELGVFELEHHPHIWDIIEDRPDAPSLAQSIPLIKANTNGWNMGETGSGQDIVIIDSGVEKTHPFLTGKVIDEACYSTNSSVSSSLCPGDVEESTAAGSGVNCMGAAGCDHGTHVAGIAAGRDPGGVGYSGVAKDANIISIQVYSRFNDPADCGATPAPCVLSWLSDQKLALERAYALRSTRQIAAVNLSLGAGQYSSACDSDARKVDIDNLRAAGIPVVIASGNSGYKTQIAAPACISSAVSVGATCDYGVDSYCKAVDAVASFSNTASFISLMAPGGGITSSVPGSNYSSWMGTSMAAPHVAGAWALKKQGNPAATVDELLQYFRTNALTINDTRSGGTVTGLKRIQLAATTSILTVTKTGSGTVTSAPAGISCGSTCSASFPLNASVTLSATPSSGYTFSGWSGSCTGTGSCTVTMSTARSATANFAVIPQNMLTVSASSGGTVASSPAGINCGSTCSASFPPETTVTLTATPGYCYVFSGWGGACSGSSSTCTVSMTVARNVTASFTALPTLTYFRDYDGDGYGDPAVSQSACSKPAGYVSQGGDCNDLKANINPGMAELCEPYGAIQVDDNCDGLIFDPAVGYTNWYYDTDLDGYGAPDTFGHPTIYDACAGVPVNYVDAAPGADCDESDMMINPGSIEIVGDAIDNNCNGLIDESGSAQQSVMLTSSGWTYDSVQPAYDAAVNSDDILMQETVISGGVNLNRNVTVTLSGGYDSTLTSRPGLTILSAPTGPSVVINNGKVIVDRIILR